MNRKNDSRLHVVFASDENFVLQLEVAAKSLIKSCAGSEVVVDILDCEITNQTWEDLSSRLSAYAKMCGTELGVCRHLVQLDDFAAFRTWNASRATYARLLIPSFLADVRYCVYSDCDVLFLSNPIAMINQIKASGKMNARPLIVSAIRDEAMYKHSIAQNRDCGNCDKFAIDNRERNESIPVLYNRAIEQTLANVVDRWMVFAHEDFEPLEPLDEVLKQADPQRIYGIIGGRLLPHKRWLLGGIWSGVFYGEIMQTEKDRTNKITVGNRTPSGTVVETVDCQFIAVHTLLLRRLPLRFDENLTFDLYAEDFCLAAWVRHSVKSAILNFKACHHSSGNIAPRFFEQKQYLDRKYPKHEAFSVVGYTIGGGRTVMRRMQKKVRGWIDRHVPRLLKWYFKFVD